jgi:hypothetical protein
VNKQIDFVLAAKMTESMLRLKNKVSFRDMEGYVETGSQEKPGRILVDLHVDILSIDSLYRLIFIYII